MPRTLSKIQSWIGAAGRHLRDTFDELFPPIVSRSVRDAEVAGFQIDPPTAYCHRCGASTGPGEATERGCSHCLNASIAWDRIVRLGLYTSPLADWIKEMKFDKHWGWAPWFGRELAKAATPIAEPQRTVVCDLPIPWMRRWKRGFSQSWLMARAFAKAAGLQHFSILRRIGYQPPQTSIDGSQRERNVRNAFGIVPVSLKGWHVWIIDDVKSTGSSLTPCVRLLKQAGAESVTAAVVAVRDPKGSDFKAK